jgi:aryl-alcohol dehydrogenase-like predicted oxidoreductase
LGGSKQYGGYEMEYRQLGQSELKVSAITFGAWAIGGWMWGGADKKDALEAIQAAADNGITTIDTAPVYGLGLSEEIVGEALQGGLRKRMVLLTKFGLRWDSKKGSFYFHTNDNDGKPVNLHRYSGADGIVYECEQSLRRLKTDYIDLYQIHWPDPTTPVEETMNACQKLVDSGKVRAVGVCNYSADLMEQAESFLHLASDQVPYSMVNRGIEEKTVPYCLDKKIGILAYSPLQRGFLTGKFDPDHKFNEGDHRADSPFFKKNNYIQILNFLKKIEPLATDKGATLAQLVIKWTIEQPGITSALVGARNKKQVIENVQAGNISLSASEIDQINKWLGEMDLKTD